MTHWLDDEDESLEVPSNLPSVVVECEHRLIYKLEQHALAMYGMAMRDEVDKITFDRAGMIEVSTAILQVLSILRKGNVS